MTRPVVPAKHTSAVSTDGWFDMVAWEALTIGLPNGVKSVAFSTSGNGAGATMTITLS